MHSRSPIVLFASLSLADENRSLSLLVVSGKFPDRVLDLRAKAPRVTRSEKGYGDKFFKEISTWSVVRLSAKSVVVILRCPSFQFLLKTTFQLKIFRMEYFPRLIM